MSESDCAVPAKAPWHLWLVGILALLWNAMGCFDYVMTQTKNGALAEHFTQEQLDYIYGRPSWLIALWAIAVWGGLLGAVLLLVRKRFAFPALAVSLVCMVITAIYEYGLTESLEVMGVVGLVFTIVIFVTSLFLVLYSRAMVRRGVLR